MTTEDEPAKRPGVPKVACPHCGEWESRVKDGRPSEQGYKRQRLCEACGKVYATIEKAA